MRGLMHCQGAAPAKKGAAPAKKGAAPTRSCSYKELLLQRKELLLMYIYIQQNHNPPFFSFLPFASSVFFRIGFGIGFAASLLGLDLLRDRAAD